MLKKKWKHFAIYLQGTIMIFLGTILMEMHLVMGVQVDGCLEIVLIQRALQQMIGMEHHGFQFTFRLLEAIKMAQLEIFIDDEVQPNPSWQAERTTVLACEHRERHHEQPCQIHASPCR